MHKFVAIIFTLVAGAMGKPSHLAYSAPYAVAHSSQVLARHYNGLAAPFVPAPIIAPVPYAVAAPPAIAAVPHPVAAYHAHPVVHHPSLRYAGLPHAHAHAHIAPFAANYHGLAPLTHPGFHHGVAALPYTGLPHAHLGHSVLPHAHVSHTALAQTHHHPYASHFY